MARPVPRRRLYDHEAARDAVEILVELIRFLHARKLNPEPNWKRNSIAVLAACSLGGCMTQRGIPAAGTVVESRGVTTVDAQLRRRHETEFKARWVPLLPREARRKLLT